MSGLRYWTNELVVDAIRRWHEHTGQPPRKLDWSRSAPDHPSSRTVIERFGTWDASIRAAGLPCFAPPHWTRESAIAKLRGWVTEHGELPTTRAWGSAGGSPSQATLSRLFGSWNAAIAAAGFTPRRPFATAGFTPRRPFAT